MSLLEEFRERRVTQYVLTYFAAGWVVLQVVDQLVDRAILPEVFYPGLLTFLIAAFPGAVVLAWFHGAKGSQQTTRMERLVLLGVGVFALSATVVVVRPEAPEISALDALGTTQDPRRVAVLYFDSRGGEDADFLSSGLTESLIDELSGVDALTVVSRNGSRMVEGSTEPPQAIAETLEVGTLVTGTVAQAGERVRVEVDMIEGGTGRQFESTTLERPRAEIFELQDELATRVALFLRERIGEEIEIIEGRSGTRSAEAWEMVQEADRARDAHYALAADDQVQAAMEQLQLADSLLTRAEDLDPDWLRPVVDRGWVAYEESRLEGFDRSAYDRLIGVGMEHADQALAMDSTDSRVLELRATLQYWRYLLNLGGSTEGQEELYASAERQLRAAVAADPRNATAWSTLSHLLTNRAEPAAAKLAAQRSYEADPYVRNANLTLWRLFSNSWELEDEVESERWCEEGYERFPADPRFSECRLMLFALPGIEPDIDAAWEWRERYVERSPTQRKEINARASYIWVATALARAGMPDSARAVAMRGRASSEVDPVREMALLEAVPRTALGDLGEAVRLLSIYFAANPGQVDRYREQVVERQTPWYFSDLGEEPEFLALLGLE